MSESVAVAVGRRQQRRADNWLAVRDAAYRLIAERGYEAVSVDDIAAEGGVSRATFFNYFPNKLSVLSEPAPGEREGWLVLFDRPRHEALWDSLVEILVGYSAGAREQLVNVWQVYQSAPELKLLAAARTHPLYDDLHAFLVSRTNRKERAQAELVLNIALAVGDTAFDQWSPRDRRPFDVHLREVFDRVELTVTALPPARS